MKMWRWSALGMCLLSLILSLNWGPYAEDAIYMAFNEARDWTAVSLPASFWTSPLHFVILWLGAQLQWQQWLISLVINGICWGGLAVLAVRLLAVPKNVAAVTAVLITLSPSLHLQAGTHIPLALLAAFLALFLTKQQAWPAQTLVLLLLPLLHFDLAILILLFSLLWLRWRASGSLPTPVALPLLAAYGLWAAWRWSALGPAGLFTFPPSFAEVTDSLGQLVWLFIPLMALGLMELGIFSLRSQPILYVAVGWTAVSLLSSGEMGVVLTVVTGWLLVGCGLHYLLTRLQTSHKHTHSLILTAITLPLFAFSLLSLGQLYDARPLVRYDLENQASTWLQAHSQPQNTLMASAHLLNLGERSGTAWPEQALSHSQPLINALQTAAPDYVVTSRAIPFDQLQRAAWFQENYIDLQQFDSPYESTAPLTIWGYRPTVYGLGEGRPLNVQTDYNISIVGYQYDPARLQPGEDLSLTLFLQATEPAPPPLNAWLRLVPYNDSQEWVRAVTPIMADWTKGTVVTQIITATMPLDSPIGAYQLSASLQRQGQESVLALYRNNDVHMLDRVELGNVILLEEAFVGDAVPIDANFGDQITLLSYALTVQPDALFVDLFWQATQPPTADYVVFVHLLGADEQLIVSQDGPPLDGRFPTTAWRPNDIIPDRHRIPLSPENKGSYQLNIGLYLPITGERLSITSSDGTPVPNNSLTLQIVEIE